MKAETKVKLAKLQQDSRVRIQETVADGALKVTKLQQDKKQVLTELNAKAVAEAQELKARTDVYEQTKLSEARLAAARNEAQAAELLAKAEGVSAPYLDASKSYETRKKQIAVWGTLASNPDLVVSGAAGE